MKPTVNANWYFSLFELQFRLQWKLEAFLSGHTFFIHCFCWFALWFSFYIRFFFLSKLFSIEMNEFTSVHFEHIFFSRFNLLLAFILTKHLLIAFISFLFFFFVFMVFALDFLICACVLISINWTHFFTLDINKTKYIDLHTYTHNT